MSDDDAQAEPIEEIEVPWWLDDPFYPGDDAEHAAWLAGLPADVRAEYDAGPWTGAGESIAAGFLHRDRDGGPAGVGFASGGALDTLAPGPMLADAALAATRDGHEDLGESELIGVLCAWQRLASWAQAGQAAAVIALARRRAAQSRDLQNPHLAEHTGDEVAAALTLTGRSAGRLLEISAGLARLPGVVAALQRGEIDWPKACLFADQLAVLDDHHALAIAENLAGPADAMTTGQLRAALARAVLAADPGAADRRSKEARKDAEVQAWTEPSGNGALAGRELPLCEVIAASQRLTRLAQWLSARGAPGTISQLRAAAYSALLAGRPVQTLLPPDTATSTLDPAAACDASAGVAYSRSGGTAGSHGPDDDSACSDTARSDTAGRTDTGGDTAGSFGAVDDDMAGRGWPQLTGTINLTMPLTTWLSLSETPGEVAGHGPADAETCRRLASLATQARWCLTLASPDGRAVAHACARRGPPTARAPDCISWAAGLRKKLHLLETGDCRHPRQAAGYHPPGSLRHLITIRQRTCSFPGCRRPARRCDLDHTIAYGSSGGITCECNLAPLCRRHHQAKQAPGWHLQQDQPGQMTWTLPSGRTYHTTGEPYPV